MKITLKNLHKATAQQVFDQVARHLLTQRRRSLLEGGCRYHYEGLMCAAGCLIAEDEYDRENMEGYNWRSLASSGLVPRQHEPLICALQLVHDEFLPDEWQKELEHLAAIHDLKMP